MLFLESMKTHCSFLNPKEISSTIMLNPTELDTHTHRLSTAACSRFCMESLYPPTYIQKYTNRITWWTWHEADPSTRPNMFPSGTADLFYRSSGWVWEGVGFPCLAMLQWQTARVLGCHVRPGNTLCKSSTSLDRHRRAQAFQLKMRRWTRHVYRRNIEWCNVYKYIVVFFSWFK